MTTTQSARSLVLPLALAQFIASYAGTNMNVAISTIASDLGCSVSGIQTTITLFTLTMAALMIPGSKLTDIWGRKRCFVLGLTIYGTGALLASTAQGLPLLVLSYSLLEGVGSALMIPPIYILITVAFTQMTTRAKYFGVVSGAGGLGAAAGPLIGGLITSGISWRASFVVQFLVVATIVLLAQHIVEPPQPARRPHFDLVGAVLSAAGLFFVVFGVLQSATFGWTSSRQAVTIGGTEILPKGSISPVWILLAIGVVILAWCMLHLHSMERAGKEPLFSLRLFRNRTSNLGLVTQTAQWLVLQGSFFVISVFLQDVRHFNAIETGLTLTPATLGILAASAAAQRMAQRRPQAVLVRGGFVLTVLGIALLLALVRVNSSVWTFVPGLLLAGIGLGVMLTASVNVVQSSFSDEQQGDISGISRSVSNLGSSLGVALAGSILVAKVVPGNTEYIAAMTVLGGVALIGLAAAMFIRKVRPATAQPGAARTHEEAR
ncbi:MAG TPA: MFS transporter [Jatrophihabitans sp.]|nr:MFS transporter [Jatrophihabitans sp.]